MTSPIHKVLSAIKGQSAMESASQRAADLAQEIDVLKAKIRRSEAELVGLLTSQGLEEKAIEAKILTQDRAPISSIIAPWAPSDEVLHISVDEELNRFGADIARVAMDATQSVLNALPGCDFAGMARNSPELRGYDWNSYLHLSVLRIARTLDVLKKHIPAGGRVLDFGSYFGNFSIALARSGYRVDALDAYGEAFGGDLAPFAKMIGDAGGALHEIENIGYDLAGFGPGTFDCVLFMGAIEHVPHTPRLVLNAITQALKPGGILVLDTPNLGYVYNRRKFLSGETIFPPIQHQFESEPPFFGHHREYLPQEVRWMLERVGHTVVEESTYNYSVFGMTELRGEHLASWRLMEAHPQLRELVFVASRTPGA